MTLPLSRRDWLRIAGLGGLGYALVGRARLGAMDVEPPPPEGRHINLAGNENAFGPSPAVMQAIFKAAALSSRYPFREDRAQGNARAARGRGGGKRRCSAMAATRSSRSPPRAPRGRGGTGGDGADLFPDRQVTPTNSGRTVRWVPFRGRCTMTCRRWRRRLGRRRSSSMLLIRTTRVARCGRRRRSRRSVGRSRRGRRVLLDGLLELGDDFAAQTQVPLVRAGLPVIIGRSFSKMHGLAGHRIGYAVTTPKLAAALSRMQMSSVNYLGVAAARAALLDREFPAWSRKKIAAGRAQFAGLLDELGLVYTPSHGNSFSTARACRWRSIRRR